MSEEQEATTETVEQTTESQNDSQEVQTQETEPSQAPQERTPGYNQIDFKTASPEEVEKRFNRLYGQVKSNQRTLSEYQSIAQQQSQLISDLQSGVGMVANHLQTTAFKDSEERANAKFAAAMESGDVKAITAANNELAEIKARQMAAEQLKQQLPKQTQQQPREQVKSYNNAREVSSDALAEGDISPQEKEVLDAWSGETTDSGSTIRPWITNSTGDPNDPDPDYVKAWVVANKVFANQNLNFNQKLAEIDRQMGVSKSQGGQTVLAGKFTNKSKTSKITLSPEIERVAVRNKFGGPKAKTDAEHIQAYREQMQKVQSQAKRRAN